MRPELETYARQYIERENLYAQGGGLTIYAQDLIYYARKLEEKIDMILANPKDEDSGLLFDELEDYSHGSSFIETQLAHVSLLYVQYMLAIRFLEKEVKEE